MKNKINKQEFEKLDFESKCAIIEQILTDDYFNGQTEINFYIPKDFKGEIGKNLPQTPYEIKKEEDEKFIELIQKLEKKLFSRKSEIEFDTD
ncbi:hypothetical protein [Kaistella sp.]|uniref:hypothetical protein n=1 Tax=Kaistella sp. TaxID=2782235 RepID=UPI003C45DFBE